MSVETDKLADELGAALFSLLPVNRSDLVKALVPVAEAVEDLKKRVEALEAK